MKKYLCSCMLLSICLFAAFSCSNSEHETDFDTPQADVRARALTLGFETVEEYYEFVESCCASGDHSNCHIYGDKHEPCRYKEHSGTHHNGSHHAGNKHENHHTKPHHQHH
ncbi:MAG: hypothetical protein ACRC9P_02660 [Bacteroides sp.]